MMSTRSRARSITRSRVDLLGRKFSANRYHRTRRRDGRTRRQDANRGCWQLRRRARRRNRRRGARRAQRQRLARRRRDADAAAHAAARRGV